MTKEEAERRLEMAAANPEGSGRNPREYGAGASSVTARTESFHPETLHLIEAVVERENMKAAYHRVKSNRGAPGVDGMTVDDLAEILRENWPRIREDLLEGRYRPQPVLRVDIAKPGGKGTRQLGIPTVLDRLVQQAVHQVLQPVFDPDFSESSYGFRPGRSAHQAVLQAREYAADGRGWVVDLDLEKFFDRVNHDVLMSRVARRVKDKRLLGLIRMYLTAGVMSGGVVSQRTQGTPQGGPLSPLLSNILLDDLDKELEKRGHAFCRYADDCNIYMRSKRAGQRVMASVACFLEKRLKLKVNWDKSAVDRPWNRKFLGYGMTRDKQPRLKVASAGIKRFKVNLRRVFREGRGRSLSRTIDGLKPILRGWANYFRLAEVTWVFVKLDSWIRRRMRLILWRQWNRTPTKAKNLIKRGVDKTHAWVTAKNGRGPWWNSNSWAMKVAFPNHFFYAHGLVSLQRLVMQLQCRS